MTARRGRRAPIERFERDVEAARARLEAEDDYVLRANIAADLAAACQVAAEVFGEERTVAFVALRDLGWTLGDLAVEFNLSRARAAQIACRDRYKSGQSRGGGGRAKKP